jgi:hypothetical protein
MTALKISNCILRCAFHVHIEIRLQVSIDKMPIASDMGMMVQVI